MGSFTKSERRQFERDIYDYAEALGLDHAAAKKQVIKARGFCGEENYDSDNSALGDELDNSVEILKRLGAISGPEPEVVMPSIENTQSTQVQPPPKPKPSPKKSPYFVDSGMTSTQPKKSKANPDNPRVYETKDDYGKAAKRSKKRKYSEGSDDHKAAERALKKAEKAKARAKRDSKPKAGHNGQISALEPNTEAEAHENYLRSNQRDPHEHQQTLDQTEEERAENARKEAAFVADLRDNIRYVNEKQVDLYDQGKMENETQKVKNDLKDLKERREYRGDLGKETRKSGHKKRKGSDIIYGEKNKSKNNGQTERDF